MLIFLKHLKETNELNTELYNLARDTDDTAKAAALVAAGADLSYVNSVKWGRTALHQAVFHGRFEMVKTLMELGAPLELHSNPSAISEHGTPY